jgi:hypothetical protein
MTSLPGKCQSFLRKQPGNRKNKAEAGPCESAKNPAEHTKMAARALMGPARPATSQGEKPTDTQREKPAKNCLAPAKMSVNFRSAEIGV